MFLLILLAKIVPFTVLYITTFCIEWIKMQMKNRGIIIVIHTYSIRSTSHRGFIFILVDLVNHTLNRLFDHLDNIFASLTCH